MTGFELSPGITPALVGAVAVELPLALGLGYLFFRGRGFEFALGWNGIVLGSLKVLTDYRDLYDTTIALLALVGGLTLVAQVALPRGRAPAFFLLFLGVYGIPFGATKLLGDFYDPFDLVVADLAVVLGLWAILQRWKDRSTEPAFRRRCVGFVGGTVLGLGVLLWGEGSWGWPGWPWAVVASFPLLLLVAAGAGLLSWRGPAEPGATGSEARV
jgi:hypothetical protein